jgi:regulatory protein
MCATIERIETVGPGSKARRLIFDDGSEPRLTSAAAIRELKLVAGAHISAQEVDTALAAVEYVLAKNRALRLLGYREHSAMELRRKLEDTGYPHAIAQVVTDRFVEIELVDDARFAQMWTRTRLAAGYGPRRIKQELALRGIEALLVEQVLADSTDDGVDDVDRARAALHGRVATDRASRDRLMRRLINRGFSPSDAHRALDTPEDDFEE